MTDELVTFKTAKLAKDNGFDKETINMYVVKTSGEFPWQQIGAFINLYEHTDETNCPNHNVPTEFLISAPTQSLLQKWLREKHSIHVFITKGYGWEYNVQKRYIHPCDEKDGTFNSYEDALEEGLQMGLKLIK